MTARLNEVSSVNAYNSTLDGSLTAGAETITVTSVTGLVAPGILCIDREDSSGNATPSKREYIRYTGISGNDLTGVVRGQAGSTDQNHSSGALIEENWSVGHWIDTVDFLQVEHDSAGRHVISTATITTAVIGKRLNVSAASNTFGDILVSRHLYASGASISFMGINPVWNILAQSSAATLGIGTSLPMPHTGAWDFFSVTLARGQAVSACSLLIDVNLGGTSIFEAGTRPFILGGGTFVSTASIATKLFTAGNVVNVDIDSTHNLGDLASSTSNLDFTVLGHAAIIGR